MISLLNWVLVFHWYKIWFRVKWVHAEKQHSWKWDVQFFCSCPWQCIPKHCTKDMLLPLFLVPGQDCYPSAEGAGKHFCFWRSTALSYHCFVWLHGTRALKLILLLSGWSLRGREKKPVALCFGQERYFIFSLPCSPTPESSAICGNAVWIGQLGTLCARQPANRTTFYLSYTYGSLSSFHSTGLLSFCAPLLCYLFI